MICFLVYIKIQTATIAMMVGMKIVTSNCVLQVSQVTDVDYDQDDDDDAIIYDKTNIHK